MIPDRDTRHVIPVNDLVDHEDVGDDCVCGPRVELIQRDGRPDAYVVVHHSLDGRERHEGGRT